MAHTTIISPAELASRSDESWVLLDCRFSLTDTEEGRKRYEEGHITGAHYAHLDHDLSGRIIAGQTGRHPMPEPTGFRRRLGMWGISPETQVVAYDQGPGAFAARAWWLLRHYGHEAVAVLDGGVAAWTAAGLPLATDEPRRHPDSYPTCDPLSLSVDADWIFAHLNGETNVVDARASERYQGLVEPLDPVAGHIPGAQNRPWKDNLKADGTLKAPGDLRAAFESFGPAQDQVHYCGSGVTAAHNVLAMHVAGLQGAKLYPGSWSEWITDSGRPVG
jgi:thiosulfate/3-mercaptopyruvate sulfurtransferase